MQSAYALADWIAREHRLKGINGDVRKILSRPRDSAKTNRTGVNSALKLLEEVITGKKRKEFIRFLAASLELPIESYEIHSILWEEPRPLFLEVIPTLLRQLESEWQIVEGGKIRKWKDSIADKFMPRFVPQALFGDLNLPELDLVLPDSPHRRRNDDEKNESMPLGFALIEFSPGRINKRFSAGRREKENHWLSVPIDALGSSSELDLGEFDIEFNQLPTKLDHDGTAIEGSDSICIVP